MIHPAKITKVNETKIDDPSLAKVDDIVMIMKHNKKSLAIGAVVIFSFIYLSFKIIV